MLSVNFNFTFHNKILKDATDVWFKCKASCCLKSILFYILFTWLLIVFSFLKAFIPVMYERFAYAAIGTGVAFLTTYLFLSYDKK